MSWTCLELVTRKDRLGSSKWSEHRAAHRADASSRNSRHHCKRWSIRCCERARHGGQTGSVTAGRSTRAAVSHQVSRLRSRPARACMRLCLDARANEQNRGSPARNAKAFRPANWSARRAASESERCSYAVLECGFYIRFAVTKQLKMGRAQFEFCPLMAGRAPPIPCYAWRKAASGLAE
jgi:hypothetical protein